MLLFIDHVAAKTLILPAMDTVAGGSMHLIAGARGHIHGIFRALCNVGLIAAISMRIPSPRI